MPIAWPALDECWDALPVLGLGLVTAGTGVLGTTFLTTFGSFPGIVNVETWFAGIMVDAGQKLLQTKLYVTINVRQISRLRRDGK